MEAAAGSILTTLPAGGPDAGIARRRAARHVRTRCLDQLGRLISPVGLYLLLAAGCVGVATALPRRGVNPRVIGAVAAAAAGGLVLLLLGLRAGDALPNFFFYVFAFVALAGALRVITHPRPVYAALYFVMTVLASAGLFVILSAEFVAFALIIVYAGAILITYLFVIMLATQAPTPEQVEALAEYDAQAREPLAATVVGFLLLGVLTTMLFRGVGELRPTDADRAADASVVERLPGRVGAVLRREGAMRPGEHVASVSVRGGEAVVEDALGRGRTVRLPDGIGATNVEGVAFTLLADKPGSIEIAGVILLMAMLGAVVLARKQVQLDEDAKARHAARLGAEGGA